eukprot:CAMPEP_0176198688 /NCGR_PEP_ID=MMETSP0121_2-20121125/8179_1 /TAXON_ID=160619 /ORGANISM="Kryptoperidinium foliaceum, Strain CCMP 1326" /LENGTH=269 /DNA_ID=CAMNT_0017537541 /DNA_START=70 /DNA_END=876 /DNA_ORIENTATION=-
MPAKTLALPMATAKRNRATVMQRVAVEDGALDSKAREDLLLQQAAEVEDKQATPTIALVAHDNMKKLMRQFVQVHLEMLKDFKLTGTGTTCAMLRSEGLEPMGSTASGPLGGDQQIGAMIVEGEVDAVFFFRDPFSSHAHIADIEALSRLVDCYQSYYGSNYRSSSAVLSFMHGNLKRRTATGARCSVMKPSGVEDLAETVQEVRRGHPHPHPAWRVDVLTVVQLFAALKASAVLDKRWVLHRGHPMRFASRPSPPGVFAHAGGDEMRG